MVGPTLALIITHICHCFELVLSFCNVKRFNSVQCGNNFYQNLVLMMGETETCKKRILQILNEVNVWTLWLLIHVWKRHLIRHKQLFPKTIREEKILMHKNVAYPIFHTGSDNWLISHFMFPRTVLMELCAELQPQLEGGIPPTGPVYTNSHIYLRAWSKRRIVFLRDYSIPCWLGCKMYKYTWIQEYAQFHTSEFFCAFRLFWIWVYAKF